MPPADTGHVLTDTQRVCCASGSRREGTMMSIGHSNPRKRKSPRAFILLITLSGPGCPTRVSRLQKRRIVTL